jgi:hypothetical protein
MHCNTCGGRCAGDCEDGDEQFENVPIASGQLASAGEATVRTGWKLAPGWEQCYAERERFCSNLERHADGDFRNALWEEKRFGGRGACRSCAVEMGALVRDEPPAEQPSRQETPGGETACKDWCGFDGSDGDVVCMFDEERHSPPCVTGDRECVCRCSQACTGRRDRAKAKREGGGETGEAIDWSRFLPTEEIAEDMALVGYDALTRGDVFASWDVVHGGNVNRSLGIDRAETLAGGGCWWQRRVRLIRHADGRWADGYHGASVDATGSATEFEAGPCRPDCGSSDGCKSKPCFFVHAGKTYHFCTPFCRARFEADRAKAKAAEQVGSPTGCSGDECAHGNSTWDECPSCDAEMPDCGEGGVHESYCRHAGKPAEPTAPAAGTLSEWERLYNDRNSKWRDAEDKVAAIGARIIETTKAWGEMRDRLAQAERERDEATAKERERCRRVVSVWLSCDGFDDDDLREAIGKPAPGTDEP